MTQEKRVAQAVEAMKWYAAESMTSEKKTWEALHATGAYTVKGTLKQAASGNTAPLKPTA